MHRGALWATVHGVAKSQTGLRHTHIHKVTLSHSQQSPVSLRTRLCTLLEMHTVLHHGSDVPAQTYLLHLSPSRVKEMPPALYFYCMLPTPNHPPYPAPSGLCSEVHLSFEEILIKPHIPQKSSLGHTARSDIFKSETTSAK